MAKAGSVEIEITALTAKFRSGIEKANKGLDSLRDKARAAATEQRSLKRAVAGLAAVGFASKQIFELGAAVEETGSKFATVFGDQAGGVQQALSSFSTMAGLSDTAAKSITATTGAIVQGMGISGRAAADFSVEVVKLAADLSSFNNIPIEETSRAIQAAITGEREQLKRLGIVIRQVDVDQRALLNSGKSSTRQLTDQERATATLQLVTERAGSAVGDLARTQNSAANQARALGAEIQNLKEDLSVSLLPAFTVIIQKVQEFIGGLKLMGVDAAVALAKFKLAWEGSIFGSDEGLKKALDNLHHTSNAAREMREEILGINRALTGASSGTGSTGGTNAAVMGLTENAALLSVTLEHQGVTVVPTLVDGIKALGIATGQAADETNRLNSAQNKLSAISSGLGFLGRFIGPVASLASGLGAITSGIGIGETIINAFGGQKAMLDTNLSISINGISDGTTQVIRGKLSDFDKRDVPVVL